MRHVFVLTLAMVLLAISTPAFAGDTGLQATIKNLGAIETKATITRNGMSESGNPVTKTAPAGGVAAFTKAETAHDPSEESPLGWDVDLQSSAWGNCRYVVLLKDGACSVQTGAASCAKVEECGQCCFEFTVKP